MGRALRWLLPLVLAAACGTKSSDPPDARPDGRDAQTDARADDRDAQVDGRDAQVDGRDAQVDGRDAQVEPRDAQAELRDAEAADPDAAIDPDAAVGGEVVADFALEDVNPSSATFAQFVSPRDYEGQISAWFFGHSS